MLDRTGAKARALDVDVPRGETVVIDLASIVIAPAPTKASPAPIEPAPEAPHPPAPSSAPPLVTYVAFGTAAAATLAAIGFGASTLAARSDFTNAPTVAARDHFYASRTITNVAWIVAGASATVGAVFWIVSPKKEARSAIGIFVGDAGLVVAHETRF